MDNPLTKYLEDAIAAEKSFETQLRGFAGEADRYPKAKALFLQHAEETKGQYEALTSRLKALGGTPSTLKSFMAHMFNMAPKSAQVGHSEEERTTQDLMMAYSVENAEVAMYESMSIAAEVIGDNETAILARRIQTQEKQTADKVWTEIAPAAKQAFAAVTSSDPRKQKDVIVRYLQDAEAAERNFEDALATFSETGDQEDVKSLLATMSDKARTQHERLETRLNSLGASPSTAKSILAHFLAFTPVSAQMGHEPSEKNTQHLMIVYAAAAAEMAMYESLATVSHAAGDSQTAQLARELQSEEKQDHILAWQNLGDTAREAMHVMLK